jgi:hypothetical protein
MTIDLMADQENALMATKFPKQTIPHGFDVASTLSSARIRSTQQQ